MSTPNLKKGRKTQSGFLDFQRGDTLYAAAQRVAYLIVELVAFIPFSQVEYNGGGDDHTL